MTTENTEVKDPIQTAINADPGIPKAPPVPSNEPPKKDAPKKDADDGLNEEHGVPLKKDDTKKADDPPTDETPTDEQPRDDDGKWKANYIEMQDPAGQSVINLLKESGVTPVEANAIFQKAIESGDIKDVQWEVLESRLGKDKAALARIGIESYYNGKYQANQEVVRQAHEIVGGKENWNKVAAWVRAQEKANPSRKPEFDEIRKGLDSGGKLAIYAAKELRDLYQADKSNTGLGTSKVTTGDRQAPVDAAPLSRRDYIAALHEAQAKGLPPQEIAALNERRRAGMRAGL